MAGLRPILPVRRGPVDVGQVPRSLATVSHCFLRVDAVKKPLTPPYDGPYRVLARTDKTFTIMKNEKPLVVSIDRVKPAFLPDELLPVARDVPDPVPVLDLPPVPVPPSYSRAGRLLRRPERF